MGTRVLKHHLQAVVDALPRAVAARRVADNDNGVFAQVIAEAVLSAGDYKTVYCLVMTAPESGSYVFGPYQTLAAAEKAARQGLPTLVEGATVRIKPLIPHPKLPTVPTRRTAR